MEDGTVYEISSIKPRVKTKMLVFGEARNTILNLIIGTNVQTYIKIKASDLVQVLEEMKVIDKIEIAKVIDGVIQYEDIKGEKVG